MSRKEHRTLSTRFVIFVDNHPEQANLQGMPDDDSPLRFPCYFAHAPEGNPEIVEIDGNICLCLFTSQAHVIEFADDKYRQAAHRKPGGHLGLATIRTAADLASILRSWRRMLDQQDCRFVAFAPGLGKPLAYAPMEDVIAECERLGNA